MAEKLLQLNVVTPERTVVREEVEIVAAPGLVGEFGVLPGHLPFVIQLQPGEVRYRKGESVEYLAVTGGYAEVLPDKVTILAPTAERAREIDVDRARAAKERAEERLKSKEEGIDVARAEAALKRAMARLRVVEKVHV